MTIQPEAPETEGRSGLSRRTVLKGAAHAAWAIPAVQVVTNVAHADGVIGSNTPSSLIGGVSVTNATWNTEKSTNVLTLEIALTNNGGSSTSRIDVRVDFTTGWQLTGSATGWQTTGGSGTITFYTTDANYQIGPKETKSLVAVITSNKSSAITVSVTAIPDSVPANQGTTSDAVKAK